MPFDGLTIRAVTRELNQDLGDARIDKIHHPERDELIFSLRSPRIGSARLVLSANPRWARMHISTEKKNQSQPALRLLYAAAQIPGGGKDQRSRTDGNGAGGLYPHRGPQ